MVLNLAVEEIAVLMISLNLMRQEIALKLYDNPDDMDLKLMLSIVISLLDRLSDVEEEL